jgi:hypothetical protein
LIKILGDLKLRIKYYTNNECFVENEKELEIIFIKIEEQIKSLLN